MYPQLLRFLGAMNIPLEPLSDGGKTRVWAAYGKPAYLHNFGLLAAFGDAQKSLIRRLPHDCGLASQNEPFFQQFQVGSPKHLPFEHFESIILPLYRSIANL